MPLPRLIGGQPRPRALVLGAFVSKQFLDDLEDLVPTIRRADFIWEFEQNVRQAELDCLIIFGDAPSSVADHLFVIQFGGTHLFGSRTDEIDFVTEGSGRTVSTEFLLQDHGFGVEVTRLCEHDLIPGLQSLTSKPCLARNVKTYRQRVVPPWDDFTAFLTDADGRRVTGSFKRASGSQWWWIPGVSGPDAHLKWVRAAVSAWSEVDSERFPAAAPWAERARWQTAQEIRSHSAVSDHMSRRAAVVSELDRELATLTGALEAAHTGADAGERRLVTSQGDELLEQVALTLEGLGFSVERVDATRGKPGDLLEDLRVYLDDWVALCEVRGYTGGAQLRDLLRIQRFVRRYITEEGREPNSVWYIVNHLLSRDPELRDAPLASNPAEVATFGEDSGAVIDTRDLFTLRKAVELAQMSAADARRVLMEARGRLDLN